MASPYRPRDWPIRRHDLIFVSRAGWRAMLATRPDLAADPLVATWVDKGWPLVGRRALPDEGGGAPLGLPLPPFAGKRRISILMPPDDIVCTAPPPVLSVVRWAAPRAWRSTLDGLEDMAARHRTDVRVFGSLAWQALTGLDYVTGRSDLDVLLPLHRDTDLGRVVADMAAIEAAAPVRLDGELIRDDGAGVNWREFRGGARDVLVKTAGGVALLDASRFLLAETPS